MGIEKYIVSPDITVLDTMEFIDINARGIAYICEYGILQSVATDGDIRRFILKNGDLNTYVGSIGNKNVKFCVNVTVAQAKLYMIENAITSVPIVDENKKIISIVFLEGQQFYKSTSLNVPVVIMAGGKGARLLPYTQVLPKPLIPIGEKTITEHIMDKFKVFGCLNFYLIVNYKRNLIKAYFQDNEYDQQINFIEESEFLGTGGGLKLLASKLNQTFFMTNCDVLIEGDYSDILDYHKKENNLLTMVCSTKRITIPYGTVSINDNGSIISMQEKPTLSMVTNTGLYIIEPEFLQYIPYNQFIHITDVIQLCIDAGLKIGAYPISEQAWLDMGAHEELSKMQNRLHDI